MITERICLESEDLAWLIKSSGPSLLLRRDTLSRAVPYERHHLRPGCRLENDMRDKVPWFRSTKRALFERLLKALRSVTRRSLALMSSRSGSSSPSLPLRSVSQWCCRHLPLNLYLPLSRLLLRPLRHAPDECGTSKNVEKKRKYIVLFVFRSKMTS